MSAVFGAEDRRADSGFELRAWAGDAPVRLGWGAAVACAADAAAALGADAEWIDLLEDWLAPETGLDWQPAEAAKDAGIEWIAAVVGSGRLRLSLPWRLIRRLPPPAPGLGLRWPALPAELVLARQPLPPEGLGALAVGGVLLLEDSFTAPWQAVLRRSGDAGGRAALCDGRAVRPVNEALREGGRDGTPCIEVRATLPARQPVPLLAGWPGEGAPLPLDAPLVLHLLRDGDLPLAEGHPMPWGRGHAMRITRLLAETVS